MALKPDGYEFQAKNGYWYVKQDGEWRLKHHVLAEDKYGMRVDSKIHRVVFSDGNRENLDPGNIIVHAKKSGKEQRKAAIREKIRILEEELHDLEARD